MDFKSKEKIALIDCNNFYISCERLFQPKYEGVPSAVLSNNDGCFIARSQEVKDLGIKMGQPVFLLEKGIKEDIKMFSSNYTLYGDISDRIVSILKRLVPKIEVYSIDESFLDLTHIDDDKVLDEIKHIKSTIERLTGIPVSIGVAPNKTLAKLCNHLSKTNNSLNGTCSYWNIDKSLLWELEIDEVWGIGRQSKKKLLNVGVNDVFKFKNLNSNLIRKMLHINGLKTWSELNGWLCFPIETEFKIPKIITCSRTFGTTVWEPMQIRNAMWTFLQTCHKKLIKERLAVNTINIFVTTNRFDEDYYVWSNSIQLTEQTQDINSIWNQINPILSGIPTRLYCRAGISFLKLRPENIKQTKLIIEEFQEESKPVVEHQKWITKRELLSSEWTTNWDQIPLVF